MAKVEFTKEAGKYYVEIKDRNLISATVTLSVEWDHDDESYGDPVGKIIIKGSDNQRKELFTPGNSGSKSVEFPITKAAGSKYELKFDRTIDATVPADKRKRLEIYHPLLTEKAAKDAIFLDKQGGDWGLKIPKGLLEGSVVNLYMFREDSSRSDGRALTAVEIPSYNGNNRMSFKDVTGKDEEDEDVPVKSKYATFYAFDFEGLNDDVRSGTPGGSFSGSGDLPDDVDQLLVFRDKDGDTNAYLHIDKKTVVVNKVKTEGATLNISLSNVILDGGVEVEPDPNPPPPAPGGCGIDPPVITQNSNGAWGVSIPPDVLGDGDSPSTITLNFQKDDNPATDNTAISRFTIKNFDGTEIQTVLDKDKTKTKKSVTFKVKSSADRFYKFKSMDNINDPVYSSERKRLEFRDDDGVDPNAWIEITSYDFTCDGKDTIVGPGECNPGPWINEGAVYDADGYEEPVTPVVDTSDISGLVCRKDTDKRVILDLKNYANKLVSFQLKYRVRAGWAQKFEFNVPNCSDLFVDGRRYGATGNEYNVPIYTRTEKGNVDMVFNFHNVDGGHEYLFVHNHVQGPEPTRTVSELVCGEPAQTVQVLPDGSTETTLVTTCVCTPTTTESWSEAGFKWPRFSGGVYITKTGGNKVSWVYEDGGGTKRNDDPAKDRAPDDQYVDIEVKEVRDTVPYVGAISMESVLQKLVWFNSDTGQGAENLGGKDGLSLVDYYEHSDKIRIRVPSEKRSLVNLKLNGADMCEFQGAGAAFPSEEF